MEAVDEFVQLVRGSHPGRRVYRLEFDSPDTMQQALPWMAWAKRAPQEEMVVRTGVMARGFEHEGRGVLIVGGALTTDEVQQLLRVAAKFDGRAVSLRRPRVVAPQRSPAAWSPAAATPHQRLLLGLASVAVILLVGLIAWSLSAPHTPLGRIHSHPERYAGRLVRVRGTVTGPAALSGVTAYVLRDETGRVVIVTGGEIPVAGREITLRGRVTPAFTAGSQTLLVIRQEPDGG